MSEKIQIDNIEASAVSNETLNEEGASVSVENKTLKSALKIIFIVAAVYALISLLFMNVTYPNAQINNQNLGMIPISKVGAAFDDDTIKIVGRDNKTVELNNKQAGLYSNFEEDAVYTQNAYKWPVELVQGVNHQFKVNKSVDMDKLKEALKSLELFKNMTEPKNAKIVVDSKEAKVEPEVVGNKLDLDKTAQSVVEAFKSGEEVVNLDSEYVNPKIVSADLQSQKDKLNNILKTQVKINMPDGSVYDLDNSKLLNENYEYEPKRLRAIVDEIIGKYELIGKEFDFTTTAGEKTKVTAQVYGNEINKEESVNKIQEALESGKGSTVDLVYDRQSTNTGDIGNTYIEVDIDNQTMYYYIDGEQVLSTPVVTGDPTTGADTPKGIFEIWSKEIDRFLEGTDMSGEHYKVHVNYWMQVDYTGVGIHDTVKRPAFGGSIYMGNGSLGCINTPLDAEAYIYEHADYGTPVIVY
ncbi:MAG: peptidoglycan binding domain-containing protein [Finegoldia sp.]|nr:peptidoglycan binding domain-containing protein [Finegoldia sp.]